MIREFSKRFVLLGAILFLVHVGVAGGIKLRYGFQPQKQYKCRTIMEVTTLPDGSGNPEQANVSVGLEMGITLTVEKALKGEQFACNLALDTLAMQISAPDREKSAMPLEYLKWKSVRMILDTRGVARNIVAPDSASSKQAQQAVGFDLFSRELLSRMLVFLEFPENSLEVGESWSYSRTDTVVRDGRRMIAQRTTQCTLRADSTIKNRFYHRIAFSTFARIEGSVGSADVSIALKGTTTSDGTLFISMDGIPLMSSAHLDSEMRLGDVKTVKQRGTLETSLEKEVRMPPVVE
ncbi:MAG: hypothetical protein ABSE41_12890 [Bacteroidota bacterium]|jgi:hypothetical protein